MNLILLSLLLFACGDKDATDSGAGGHGDDMDGGSGDGGAGDGGAGDGGAGDGGAGDGGSDGGSDGGAGDGGADGGSGDGGSGDGGGDGGGDLDYALGIDLVDEDLDQFASWGATWQTYEVGSSFEAAFTTVDGLAPRFNVLWPAAPDSGTAYPVLMMLHGSSTDVDDVDPDGVYDRCNQAAGITGAAEIITRSSFVPLALAEGFVVVVPENGFCDGWAGMGPDDPVDTGHAGYFLETVALGHLRWGQSFLDVDETRIYAVGTSLGATGAPWFASHYDRVAGVIYDSGAPDFLRYTIDKDYSGVIYEDRNARGLHIIGGEPYEDDGVTESAFYDRYVHHSLDRGVDEGAYTAPTFVIYNTQDEVAPGDMYVDLPTVLAEGLTPRGRRWTVHDVDHTSPLHTQVHSPAASYATWGALRFAQERAVAYVEAEGLADGSDWIGVDLVDEAAYASASGNSVRLGARGDSGTVVALPLPPDAIGQVQVTVFMKLTSAGNPDAPAAVLTLSDSSGEVDSVALTQNSADWSGNGTEVVRARLAATTISGTVSGASTVTVESTGVANVIVDVAVVDWEG